MAEEPKVTGTVGGTNPSTGSSDAARGLGGHSKDADHSSGKPAEYKESDPSSEAEAKKEIDESMKRPL